MKFKLKRPARKPIRDRNPVIVAIVGLTLALLFGAVAYRANDLPVIGGGTTYVAEFTESAGLRDGNEVRVAGIKVGTVTGVELDRGKVKVSFRVRKTWIGDATTASIAIKTLLGDKYLAIEPLGDKPLDPKVRIPLGRTHAPYDVVDAFQGLADTLGKIDSTQFATSLGVLATTFQNTPKGVKESLNGLAELSKTISSRDEQLARLLADTKKLSGTLADRGTEIESLIKNGDLLLGELQKRRQAIHNLLVGSRKLGVQLSGLVDDNNAQLKPALTELGKVTDILQRNQDNLDKALALTAPYATVIGNALGNGPWMEGYLCGLVTKETAPDAVPATGCMPPKQGGN
ncbi:MCE family protein [Actinocorallia lasiicapitis]